MAKKPTRKVRVRETTVEEPVGELEVEEVAVVEKAPAAPVGVETLMIVVTLVALIAAFIIINMKMKADFGEGWPF